MREEGNDTVYLPYNCTYYDLAETLPTNVTVQNRTRNIIELSSSVAVYTMVCLVMLAMGCGITVDAIRSRMRNSFSIVIGLSCQFLFMPAIGFGLAHALRLECYHAVGMIYVASCPGGTMSNFFTYWSRGDLPLSVCMTACALVLAMGFMPMNLFIYMRSWVDPSVHVPWKTIIVTIVSTWAPVSLGIVLRSKAPPKVSTWIIRIGSISGLVLIFAMGILQRFLHPEIFAVGWRAWTAVVSLPVCGGLVGLVVARATCRNLAQTKSIAYETGIQNAGIAIAVVLLAYNGPEAALYIQFPLMYGVGQQAIGGIFTGLSLLYFCIKERKKRSHKVEEGVKLEEDARENDF